MVRPPGGNEPFRRGPARIHFRGGQLESHWRRHEGGSRVLFSDRRPEFPLLPAHYLHHRRSVAAEFLSPAISTVRKLVADDWLLSWRAHRSLDPFAALSFFAASLVGQHGRVASGVS